MEIQIIIIFGLFLSVCLSLAYGVWRIKEHYSKVLLVMDDEGKLEQSWHKTRAKILNNLCEEPALDLPGVIISKLLKGRPIFWDINENKEPNLFKYVKKKCKVGKASNSLSIFLTITQPHHDFIIGIDTAKDKYPNIVFNIHQISWARFITRYLDSLLDNSSAISNLGEDYNNVELDDINSISRYIAADYAFFHHADLPIQIGILLKKGKNTILGKKVMAISTTKWEIEGTEYYYDQALDYLASTYKQSIFANNKMNEMLDEFF